MRGLAFPSNTLFDREGSYEYGSPPAVVADIPIDPALGGPAIDPAILAADSMCALAQAPLAPTGPVEHQQQYALPLAVYSQGPQGDPFAPQPPTTFFRPELAPTPVPAPRPAKKRRRPRREEECGFCQGNDTANKEGVPEQMATCSDCGRSGHPSCMQLAEIGDVLRSYPWKCVECKNCEVCQKKGDDERLLFCDFCDRGWHMDCVNPPIEEPPTGKWHCQECPPLPPDGVYPLPEGIYDPHIEQAPIPIREVSVASSSRAPPTASKGKHKAKARAPSVPSDNSDLDVGSRTVVKSKIRPRSHKKKVRATQEPSSSADEQASSPTKRVRARARSPAPLPRIRLRLPAQKGKGREREEEEVKGLFDDILELKDRDTSGTSIQPTDKQLFERSLLRADMKLMPPPAPAPPPPPETPDAQASVAGPSSTGRPLRSSAHIVQSVQRAVSASPTPSTPAPPGSAPALRIRTIRFGQFDIATWYDAPFPEEYATVPDGRLWICEFCLRYIKSRFGAVRHRTKCKARHPPGDEIYRDGTVSIFEVDGRKNKIYCQNLCLLSKMFLDHKSLFYDVEPFLFYVITEWDDFGAHFVGYFSKEKRSPKDYNVSCIMTLPVRQRQGWGNLLIDFSYLLSKKEQRLGSPEKPLSSLGALGYKKYWTLAVMRYLDTAPDNPRLEHICRATSLTMEDAYTTLTQLGMLSARAVTPPPVRPSPGQSIKYPKGRKNGVARRALQRTVTHDDEVPKGPFTPPTHYVIQWDRAEVTAYLAAWEAKGYLQLKPEKLKWSPFLLARMKKTEALEATETGTLKTTEALTTTKAAVAPVEINTPVTPVQPSLFADEEPTEDTLPVIAHKAVSPAAVADAPPPRTASPPPPTPPPLQPRSHKKKSHRARHEEKKPPANGSTADDEALAARLALEERRASRPLRSRAEELKRPAETPRMHTPRKRQRVESSPEADVLPAAPNGKPKTGEMSLNEPELDAAMVKPLLVVDMVVPSKPDPEPDEVEVKFEEAATPVTSAHSAPSDDTIVVNGRGVSDSTTAVVEEGEEDAEGEPDDDGEYL